MEFRVWGLDLIGFRVHAYCKPLINKPLPLQGIIMGILIFRPLKGRGFIT